MSKPQIEPAKIFEQAGCFHQTWKVLLAVPLEDLHATVTLAEPLAVLGAFTTELFLKCLISIETGDTPRGHDLKKLFDQLSTGTRTRIENVWNNEIAVRKREQWDKIEKMWGLQIPRDLPSALEKGSPTFERIRYSYEGNTAGVHFYLEDLTETLEALILEMKPELEGYRRMPLPLPVVRH